MKRGASIPTLAAALMVFAAGFLAGWRARGRQTEPPEAVVRIDTIYYERPQFTASSSHTVTINVPRVLFAPGPVVAENATAPGSCSEIPNNSGNMSEIPTCSADSAQMQVEVETRIYADTLYRAQVSGPVVGDWHPALDWIEIYAHTTTHTRTRRNRFALTAGVGAAYTPRGIQPTIGLQLGVVVWGF